MKREYKSYDAPTQCAEKMALWAMEDNHGFCFRGNGWAKHFDFRFNAFAGMGLSSEIIPFEKAAEFIHTCDDFVITHLCYDLKNRLERLKSKNPDKIDFPEFGLYSPLWTIRLNGDSLEIGWPSDLATECDADLIFRQIVEIIPTSAERSLSELVPEVSKADYLRKIQQCQQHIQRGDIYQANVCQEFSWNVQIMNPAAEFNRGFHQNPNPFSVLYRFGGCYCISWSPERFLTFFDSHVLSQPMKGTSPRGLSEAEDRQHYNQLKSSEKDRRENVMIVDMVRNDLSHYAVPGSVKVPELYAIEAYPRVHQMHSTVKATLKPNTRLFDALLKAFPMGSMTGAPKIKAMEIIDEIENSKRGLFSGTIGFITPDKSADFNVIIRSLIYNESAKSLSCHVGGGITALSDAESEYAESLVKFEPIRQLLEPIAVV
ncbi:MAG: anthranilate synthase component I family protein [Flavobacteriales bacterium]